MAYSDYTVKGKSFPFCPMGFLVSSIAEANTVISITDFSAPIDGVLFNGMAAMVDDEIIQMVSRSGGNMTIKRGCCDTIPQPHDVGAPVWFFDNAIARDPTEYAGTESVGVKALPRASGGPPVPVASSPALGVTFNMRFARPYPPGKVLLNGVPWYEEQSLDGLVDSLPVSWAHRDRITQQDVLVDHSADSIGPEAGVTYTIKIYRANGELLRTVAGITGSSYNYLFEDAVTDFDEETGTHEGYLTLVAVRDGLESYQGYRMNFAIVADRYGLGYRLGAFLGGFPP